MMTTTKPGVRQLPNEKAFIEMDGRQCDCPLTHVHRKRHGALGEAIQVRICCMARAVEEFMGLAPGTFFQTFEFPPSWTWDCERKVVKEYRNPDGSVCEVESTLGMPPPWLVKRFDEKGIEILNRK